MVAAVDAPDVARLFHHRWNVPVLASLDAAGPGTRSVVLAHVLGANRDSLRSSLSALIELGLVARNPGYGHPLRPEYVLTESGRGVAPECARYCDLLSSEIGLSDVGLRKWTAPLLLAVHRGNHRFNAIQSALDGITPRALTQALRLSDGSGLLFRRIEDGYPPRPEYFLSNKGVGLASALHQVAAGLDSIRLESSRSAAMPGGSDRASYS